MVMVEIDPGAGFCFGVEQVIHTAETHLRKGETVYGLGEMVHNQEEMNRLHELGLKTNSALLYIERVSISQNNLPIEFLRAYYRSDRYTLHNELVGGAG